MDSRMHGTWDLLVKVTSMYNKLIKEKKNMNDGYYK